MEVRTETSSRKAFFASAGLCVALGLSCSAFALGSVFGHDTLADGAEALALRGRLLLFALALLFVALGFRQIECQLTPHIWKLRVSNAKQELPSVE